ncbi:uncharacterized protein LOC142250075 [Anomaloglossus baeobatrachus]|uniref:uncharacterized protein LOC142250075 n=1 Tax=Anomaloglossus baeobatrachus TaxID=238106 RepID=UPI003F509364
MKIIVFLVLAGLSLAAPGDSDTNPDTRWQCSFNGLKISSDLMQKFSTLICDYKGKGALRIAPGLTDAFCKLTSGALFSTCAANILTDFLPSTITKLDDLFCKNDLTALSTNDLFLLIQNIGCFANDALGTKDTVEELFKQLGDLLAPLLRNFVIALGEELFKKLRDLLTPLMQCTVTGTSLAGNLKDKGVLCPLINILSGAGGDSVDGSIVASILGGGAEGFILPGGILDSLLGGGSGHGSIGVDILGGLLPRKPKCVPVKSNPSKKKSGKLCKMCFTTKNIKNQSETHLSIKQIYISIKLQQLEGKVVELQKSQDLETF